MAVIYDGFEIDDEGYVRVSLDDGTLSYVGHMDGKDIRFDTLLSLTYHSDLYPLDDIVMMCHDSVFVYVVLSPHMSHANMGEPELCVYPSREPVVRESPRNVPKGVYNPSPILSRRRTDGVLDLDEIPDLSLVGARYVIAWLRYAPNPSKEETDEAESRFLDAGDRKEVIDGKPIPSNLFTYRELNALMIEGYIYEESMADDSTGSDRFIALIEDDDFACEIL